MADHSPNGTSGATREALRTSLEAIPEHIGELETLLGKHRELLVALLEQLHNVYDSKAWNWGQRLVRIRNRLHPPFGFVQKLGARLLRGLKKIAPLPPNKAKKENPVDLRSINEGYERWITAHEPGPEELAKQRQTHFARQPLISLLVAVHRPAEPLLKAMLQSVAEQTYAGWELCLAEDNPADPELRQWLQEVSRKDPRVRLISLAEEHGMAGGYNAALEAATGEYIGLLDQDDTLAPFALFEVVQAINARAEADFLYSDEDLLTGPKARRKHPHFKPDWSPDTLRGHNYIGHLTVFHRALLDRVGGFRPGYEGEWHYDLVLRASEQARHIVHLARILYHRRKRPRFAGLDCRPRSEGPRKALAEHLERCGAAGEVLRGHVPHTYHVRYPLPRRPLVSLVIPNKDHPEVLERCMASLEKSTYAPYEVLIMENGSVRPETFAGYEKVARRPNVRILTWAKPFNYAAINNEGARRAAGEVLLFLNNDVEVINPDWLERMVEHALRPEVGAVGAKLYYADGRIQHAGAILGIYHGAGHYQRYFPRSSPGYGNRLVTVQDLTAVTGACLMMRKEVFEEIRGFDERFVVTFNDMDLCLKIRERGYRILWTPFAELYHHECTTRGFDVTPDRKARIQYEMFQFQWKWAEELKRGDCFYSPNLTLDREDCSLRV